MKSSYVFRLLALVAVSVLGSQMSQAQTTYTWNNTGTDWTTAANWSPNSGTPGGAGGDIAQFTVPGTNVVNNPVVNSAISAFTTLNFGSSNGSGWNLTGTGSLSVGSIVNATQNGIATRAGSGISTINLGNGSSTSLTVTGPTGTTGGTFNIGSSSSLVLTGNTVATTTGTSVTAIRGGTLVLDNSAGNPTGQRLTTSSAINLNGGGATLELRGAASGTTFSGMTGALGASGSGNNYVRTVQNGTGALAVSFASMSRLNTSGMIFFENIGTGYVGATGKPTVSFTTAPNTNSGAISSSGANPLGYAFVTNRATTNADAVVTGRVANYTGGTVTAAATTSYTGNITTAPDANTGVLFAPTAAGSFSYNISGNPVVQSVTLEPTVTGSSLTVGSGFNTNVLLVSGGNDISVTGTNLFSSTSGTRTLAVVSPGTSLSTDASLNITSNSNPTTVGGNGFLILNGSTNQIGSTTALGVLNLAGGVLRVNSSNLNLTAGSGVRLNFRGGTLEYDVSASNSTFSLSVGSAANQVSWTSNAGFAAATNTGSGGFSAYSGSGDGNGNTLTVNIGNGATPTLYWNDQAATSGQLFVSDGYALKFGSLRSNSTVIFQNNIALDGSSAAEGTLSNTQTYNRTREFNVTRGVGNSADKAQITGVISGTANSDLVKTGTGVLELTATNTYSGRTIVTGGELRITGSTSSSSAATVHTSGTLSGTGTVNGTATVLNGGGIRGDSGSGTGNLTVGGLTIDNGGTLTSYVTADQAVNSKIATIAGASTVNLTSTGGRFNIQLLNDSVLTANTQYTITLIQGNANTVYQRNGSPWDASTNAFSEADFYVIGNWGSYSPSLTVSNNNLVLILTPVPEPATIIGASALALGAFGLIRRRMKSNVVIAA